MGVDGRVTLGGGFVKVMNLKQKERKVITKHNTDPFQLIA